MNPNGNTIVKLLKIKDQEKHLKATGKKKHHIIYCKKNNTNDYLSLIRNYRVQKAIEIKIKLKKWQL